MPSPHSHHTSHAALPSRRGASSPRPSAAPGAVLFGAAATHGSKPTVPNGGAPAVGKSAAVADAADLRRAAAAPSPRLSPVVRPPSPALAPRTTSPQPEPAAQQPVAAQPPRLNQSAAAAATHSPAQHMREAWGATLRFEKAAGHVTPRTQYRSKIHDVDTDSVLALYSPASARSSSAAAASPNSHKRIADAFIRDIFARMDRNHDGHVTHAEMIKTVRADAEARAVLGLPATIGDAQRSQLESVFQGMDGDDSRTVEFHEFTQFMEGQSELPAGTPRSKRAVADGGGGGGSDSPASTQRQHAKFVTALFGRMDRNHDGKVTRAELIKSIRADAVARQVLGFPPAIGDDQRAQLEEVFHAMDADDSGLVDLSEFQAFMHGRSEFPQGESPLAAAAAGGHVAASKTRRPQPEPEPEPELELKERLEDRWAAADGGGGGGSHSPASTINALHATNIVREAREKREERNADPIERSLHRQSLPQLDLRGCL